VSRYQKGKTNLDFTESRDGEWQWHQLGHMQVCTLLQTDNHTSTPPLCFLQAGCPSCRPTNSVNALKARNIIVSIKIQVDTQVASNTEFTAPSPQNKSASSIVDSHRKSCAFTQYIRWYI